MCQPWLCPSNWSREGRLTGSRSAHSLASVCLFLPPGPICGVISVSSLLVQLSKPAGVRLTFNFFSFIWMFTAHTSEVFVMISTQGNWCWVMQKLHTKFMYVFLLHKSVLRSVLLQVMLFHTLAPSQSSKHFLWARNAVLQHSRFCVLLRQTMLSEHDGFGVVVCGENEWSFIFPEEKLLNFNEDGLQNDKIHQDRQLIWIPNTATWRLQQMAWLNNNLKGASVTLWISTLWKPPLNFNNCNTERRSFC